MKKQAITTKSNGVTSIIKKFDQYKTSLTAQSPRWLDELRHKGLTRLKELGYPTAKHEEWKYTNIGPIVKRSYHIAKDNKLVEEEAFRRYCTGDDMTIVFVNGIYNKELSKIKEAPKGVTITTIQEAIQNDESFVQKLFDKYNMAEASSFVALNKALTSNGTFVKVDDKIVTEKLIHIIHVASKAAEGTIAQPRSIVSLGRSSEATVLESHIAFTDDVAYFVNALTDVFIDENAVLHYDKIQKESQKAYHIGNTRIWQEKNSTFDSFSLMTGSAITRNDLDAVLNGEGASTILNGLYCINDTQHVDNHTSVDHRVANCTSNQLYKGILNGSSRAVFNGKIFVRAIAQQTNSYQLNKNLLLGQDCRVDTKPQLEIFADDVKCTHGATIGQLNEDEIFYLQSRSIPKKTAVKMLSQGFVDDILNNMKNEHIQQRAHILLEPTFAALE